MRKLILIILTILCFAAYEYVGLGGLISSPLAALIRPVVRGLISDSLVRCPSDDSDCQYAVTQNNILFSTDNVTFGTDNIYFGES